ncbi:Phosphatidate cytidylyltransferase [Aquisphaera giovannonii]|uniref:Phosphatidate cytidylyltransferase n=1 Tax=Aquisphaera giovannonii TaxID=406548 RepID=A0A5B9VZQ5_9BACT|nr:phosphatidate cytidylyltransferase [Aquisphaera giovannonii]QEH33461.1 Phosphatidate cytidylyltransferase [Aquisphaera giovannonii]
MLGTRVLSGLSLIAVVLGVLFLDEWAAPWFPLWFLASVGAMTAASLEMVALLRGAGLRPSVNTILGGVIALTVSNWMPHLAHSVGSTREIETSVYNAAGPLVYLSWPFLSFVGIFMVAFLVQGIQFVKPGRTMAALAATVLAIAYIGLLGSFMVQLRWLDGPYHGVIPLLFLVATAKGADTGAYTVGRLAGRHKLWPSLSPNKTVEGAIGGLAFAVAATLIVAAVARHLLDVPTLDVVPAIAFGLIVGSVAQLGDLMESMIKRDGERKDASSAVPGFGGVLDVLDSLLFAGPVAYILWIVWGT